MFGSRNHSIGGSCLNRTFMELKFQESNTITPDSLGLNRTFMELKYMDSKDKSIQESVLIEPLWN